MRALTIEEATYQEPRGRFGAFAAVPFVLAWFLSQFLAGVYAYSQGMSTWGIGAYAFFGAFSFLGSFIRFVFGLLV